MGTYFQYYGTEIDITSIFQTVIMINCNLYMFKRSLLKRHQCPKFVCIIVVIIGFFFVSFSPDIFYGGENHSIEQPQSFTCPLCGEMGFSDSDFRDHVTRQHTDSSNVQEVVSGCGHVGGIFYILCFHGDMSGVCGVPWGKPKSSDERLLGSPHARPLTT